ncbi:MAG TPA: tetratricopeptide repeat protein [Candidatus Limnocylindria bacterium]|nr:tetratricopeptide repeat protein [Candidatus Limnocylindria bacterium]
MTVPVTGFVRPELLYLLAAIPLVIALVALAYRARVRALRSFGGAAALVSRSGARWWIKAMLVVLALTSLVIALAGPYVDLRQRAARRLGVDIVLAVDVSQSMAARDVEPDRLRAARHFAEELGRQMIGSRVALVLFAGQGTVRYPPTTDPRILGEVLDNSGKGVRLEQGSSLRAGLESSLGAFPPDLDPLRQRAIVVISDGEITNSDVPEADALGGARVFTVGIGTAAGGQIPTYDPNNGKFNGYLRDAGGVPIVTRLVEVTMQSLATKGGGRYFHFVGNDAVIGELARELRTMEAVEPLDDAGAVPDERSAPFIAFAVGAVLLEWLITGRRRMPAPRGLGRPATRRGRRILGVAIGSAALWSLACGDQAISNESANTLFAAGDYANALAAYRDLQIDLPDAPELSINIGNTLHKLGEYPRALPEYGRAIDGKDLKLRAIAQYDRGNTLFKMGRYEDARDAYREVLRIDPTDRDAKFNLEIIDRILSGRPTPSGQQQGQGQGQPGGSPNPGQGPNASGQPSPSGSPEPGQNPGQPQEPTGDPTDSTDPNADPAPALRPALDEFRRGLTIDEALRVLDALLGEQRGVGQLLEGPRRGPGGEY